MQLIDIGVNLTNQRLYQQIEKLIKSAKAAGIMHQVITGTSLLTSQQAIQICETNPNYFSATAGCHPHGAKDFKEDDKRLLRDLANHSNVVAIGECGLDFNRNYSPQDIQQQVFIDQVEIACEVKLPLFLHQRDAHSRFIEILSDYQGRYRSGVIHCFTGGKQQLKDCLDLGLNIGITGWLCDERRGVELQEAVKYIPLDRIMIETDSPYLLPRNISPKPKSSTNVPANLTWIVTKLAEILELETAIVAKQTTLNAKSFFAISDKLPTN